MSIYAIGDVQGCYKELMELIALIQFDPEKDQLWFTGDLVNRGPQSLAVLRFVKNLGDKAVCVLGNHELHYLAVASGAEPLTKQDTFQDILDAEDADNLFDWMRHRPLIHYDSDKKFLLVHAGIAPEWDIETALACAREVEEILKSSNYMELFKNMYGNLPAAWKDDLISNDRYRVIINYLTRMRYIDKMGKLELSYKGSNDNRPEGYDPWFNKPSKLLPEINILFGHWAALEGKTDVPHRFALDTGCCWGNALTALRLEDLNYFSIKCHYTGVEYD